MANASKASFWSNYLPKARLIAISGVEALCLHLENIGNNSLAWGVPGTEAKGMPRAGVRAFSHTGVPTAGDSVIISSSEWWCIISTSLAAILQGTCSNCVGVMTSAKHEVVCSCFGLSEQGVCRETAHSQGTLCSL